jgi:hypothetical protein
MYFIESSHQYFIQDKEYKSFSYIKKLVEPKKDWDEIARKYAEKNKMTVEEVKALWDKKKNDACERGTLLHLHKETGSVQDNSLTTYQSPMEGDKKIIRNLETLEDGWHLELPLYNHEFEVCGTADRVFIETIRGIRYVDVLDFKTNSSIDLESYFNPRTKTYEMMTAPLNNLMNSNYWGYALQLSTYGYFLERYNYVVRKLELNHIPLVECKTKKDKEEVVVEHDGKQFKAGKQTDYDIPYLKKEAIKLLNYYKYLKQRNKLPK